MFTTNGPSLKSHRRRKRLKAGPGEMEKERERERFQRGAASCLLLIAHRSNIRGPGSAASTCETDPRPGRPVCTPSRPQRWRHAPPAECCGSGSQRWRSRLPHPPLRLKKKRLKKGAISAHRQRSLSGISSRVHVRITCHQPTAQQHPLGVSHKVHEVAWKRTQTRVRPSCSKFSRRGGHLPL